MMFNSMNYFCRLCRDLAVEATEYVFYAFLPRGDDVKCVVCRHYLDEGGDCVANRRVGVVKRRYVGSYRRATVTRMLVDKRHRVASASEIAAATFGGEGTSSSAHTD